MRIAFLTHEPYDPPSGGGSSEAPYLVREFVTRGYEPHVFCPVFPDMDRVARRDGIEIHPFRAWSMGRYARWRTLKYAAFPFALQRSLNRWLQEHPSSGVFAQHSIAGLAAVLGARPAQGPVVLNYLDQLTGFLEGWTPRFLWGPLAGALQRFECGLSRHATIAGVLAVSDPLLGRIQAASGGSVPAKSLCFGMDSHRFEYRASPLGSPPVVVMHGSMDRHHLGPILQGAMRQIARAYPETLFRFIGRGTPTLEATLNQARRDGVAVEHRVFCPYERIGAEIRKATVGMIPYEDTAGGRCAFVAKAVEYAAVGLPFVSTRLDGIAHYFDDEPSARFTDFSAQAFAEGTLAQLETRLSGALDGPAARLAAKIHRDLSWDAVARRAVDFYESLRQ